MTRLLASASLVLLTMVSACGKKKADTPAADTLYAPPANAPPANVDTMPLPYPDSSDTTRKP
jgi:hypothetical protein